MRRAPRIGIGALAIVLGGCALAAPPRHDDVVTKALHGAADLPPVWGAYGPQADVTNGWLATFQDPGLEAVVAAALANNPDLRQAAAGVEIARQNVVVVGAAMLPRVGLDFGLGATRSQDDGGKIYNSSQGMLGVAWEPDVWGKVRAQKSAAQAGLAATELDYAFARQSLAATTAKSWYLTTETTQLVALSERAINVYRDLFELVKVKYRLGKVSDLDVAEASANYNAAQSALRQAQALAGESRRTLEVLVGRFPAAELKAGADFVPLPPAIQAGLPSTLLERRPDLVAAEQLVVVAFRGEEAAKLALLPSFSLSLDAGRLSDNLLSVSQLNPWMINAGVGMSVPIYTGGALRAQIKIATAQQQQAIAGYGAVALQAFREVGNGLMNDAFLAERMGFERQVVADRATAARIAKLKYDAGSIDLLPVLQLQAAQLTAESDLIKLTNLQLANRITLHLALGGGFAAAPARELPAEPQPEAQ